MLETNAKPRQTYKRVHKTKQLYIQTYKVMSTILIIVVYHNAIKTAKYFKKQHAIIVSFYLQIIRQLEIVRKFGTLIKNIFSFGVIA